MQDHSGSECVHLRDAIPGSAGPGFACSLLGATTLDECRTCEQFQKHPEVKPWNWAVAITTAPRPGGVQRRYLAETQQALRAAGWNRWIVQEDNESLGPFANFYIAMTRLAMSQPHARAYMYLQDDAPLEIGARAMLQRELWPQNCAVAALYSPHYEPVDAGAVWSRADTGWDSPGACCYVFSPWGLRDLLGDPIVLRHRLRGHIAAIDGCVGAWASRHGGIWRRRPPLARHIGETRSWTS